MTIAAQGLWRIQSDVLIAVDRGWTAPLTVLVPSEKILTTVIDLPFASRRQRIEAAPYAVEGLIADPLDRVHVALGTEVAPRRHLCAVVRHSVMREWLATLAAAGVDRCILTPDALSLAEPPLGAWRVAVDGPRALVRTDDGAGFALETDALAPAWEVGGRPTLIAEGDPLPEIMREGVRDVSLEFETAGRPSLITPAVDLLQGPYAVKAEGRSPWRLVGAVALLGVVGHIGLTALDTLALHGMAERRETETRRLLAERQPGLEAAPDLAAAVDQVAPVGGGGEGPFIQRLGQASRALNGQPIEYRAVRYGTEAPLSFEVTASDAAAIEGAVAALGRANLPARAAASPSPTGAGAVITLQSEGGR